MPNVRIDQARVHSLRPRKSAHDIREAELKGLGVRVLASRRMRYFIHSRHLGQRIWKIIGNAEVTTVEDARSRATSLLAAIRRGRDEPALPEETVFEAVAEEVFRRYERNWKSRTRTVAMWRLDRNH